MTKDTDQKTGLGKGIFSPRNLTGGIFGKLTAVRVSGKDADGRILWECLCECGNSTIASSQNLKRKKGGTKSCGCLRSISRIKHFEANETWNKGASYQNKTDTEVYSVKHSWAKAVLRKNGTACQKCGWNDGRCDVHHIIPKAKGGLNTVDNGIVLCPNCHRVTHSLIKIGELAS